MRIAIIGGGWYGCHLACELQKRSHKVVLIEQKKQIMDGISGTYGVRLHRGPHYPRSEKTRKICQETYDLFCQTYPELLVCLEKAIYGLGVTDALGHSSKVKADFFTHVCHESGKCEELNLEESEFKNLFYAAILDEVCLVVGDPLRNFFVKKLSELGVSTWNETTVTEVNAPVPGKSAIVKTMNGKNPPQVHFFEKVINTTGHQSLLDPSIALKHPLDMKITYQACFSLFYQDKERAEKPFSFIVMDGNFPCIMPYVNSRPYRYNYIATHGKYSILGSYETADEAWTEAQRMRNDPSAIKDLRYLIEKEIVGFWPNFSSRFTYTSSRIDVVAKIKTAKDFRCALTYEYNNVIYVFPGKINNIFNVQDEVLKLLSLKWIMQKDNFKYIQGGVYDRSQLEITQKPDVRIPNTYTHNTYHELKFFKTTPSKTCLYENAPSGRPLFN